MTRKLAFTAAALSSACLLPLAAYAADATPDVQTEISIGMQTVTGKNTGQYGRYNGFTTKGTDVLLDFDYDKRDAWDSGQTSYFEASGTGLDFQGGSQTAPHFSDSSFNSVTSNNLGPEADVKVSFGKQGEWGIHAGYDAITYTGNIIDSLWTVTTSGGMGTLNNGLVPYGGASNSPAKKGTVTSFTATTLAPYFNQFQTGTRRDIVTVGGKYQLDQWTFSADVRHEHKQGSLEESMYATYGGMAFTLPVDYDTDRFDVSASYIDPDYQAVITYTYSRFTDNNIGATLPFPVSQSSLSASSGPYAQAALYATPPSNSAHYVTAMVSDKLTDTTHVNFNGRVGVELQNSTFPANSADPNLSPTLGSPTYNWFGTLNSLNQGTSATSPDIQAWVYQANIAVDTELAPHIDGRASYSIDARDVHINQYGVWYGGHAPDAAQTTESFVVPQNWFNQTAKLDVGYMIDPESQTKLDVSYAFKNVNRTNAQVEHSITNTVDVALHTMIDDSTMARLTYEHASRNGTLVYGRAWGNLETGTPAIWDTPSGAYYQAPMDSDSITARADYAPTNEVSAGFFAKFTNETYNYPAIGSAAPASDQTLSGYGEGIKRDYNLTVGPDVNWRPSDDTNVHVYYTYEQIFFDNRGNGQCADSNTGTCLGSVGYFQHKYTSSTNTAGFDGDWQATDKLKLGLNYNLSVGSVSFDEFNGVTVANPTADYQNVVSFPNIDSTMHDLKFTAAYALADNIQASLLYEYTMFKNNDWTDIAAPIVTTSPTSTSISTLGPGYAAPVYNVSTVGVVFKLSL